MQPHICETLFLHVSQRLRHTIYERFRADEPVIRQQVSAKGEVFAPAKADLEMQRPVITEQHL